jgi:Peptidase A4 family
MQRSLSSALAAALVLAAPLVGVAQIRRQLQPNEHALNLPGTTTIDAPPAGFDPITASDDELAYHGFPPRPSQSEQKAYASWVKAMKASKVRLVPKLEQTAIFHGPAKPGKAANPTAVEPSPLLATQASNTYYSSNWSGYVDFSGASSYGSSSFFFIQNDFVVPIAQQAFYGACTNGWDYGSAWNGIDGWGSPDVLQAGIEFDAYCFNGGLSHSTLYSAWYEWYPYSEVRITSLYITPGDDIWVEVWHTSSTQGYAYLVNLNTNKSVTVGFTAYPGYPLVGNSAEWVVERPTVGGSPANLTNYIMDPFWDAHVYTEGYSAFYDIDEATPVAMTDNNGSLISYPEYLGVGSFVMHDTGSAY